MRFHKLISAAATIAAIGFAGVANAQTNFTGGAGGTIPDASGTPSTPGTISSSINVASAGTITSFNSLSIVGLNHTWIGDLVITLTHSGTTVDVIDRVGSTAPGGVGSLTNFVAANSYVFALTGADLTATVAGQLSTFNIPGNTYATVPNATGGISTANGTLAAWNGLNVNGLWTLTITDNVAFDTGSFTGWSFNATVAAAAVAPEPASLALVALGGLAVAGIARRRRS